MKTLQNILFVAVLFNFNLIGQNPNFKIPENKWSIVEYKPNSNPTTLTHWNDLFGEKKEEKNKTLPLIISSEFIENVLIQKDNYLNVEIPFFNNNQIELILKRKDLNLDNFQLIIKTKNGAIEKKYNPGFLVYEVYSENDQYEGFMIFSKTGLNASSTFRPSGKLFTN